MSAPALPAHSAWPASSAARNIACPGAYAMTNAPGAYHGRASIHAATGTVAHSVLELAVQRMQGDTKAAQSLRALRDAAARFSPATMTADGFTIHVDDEMLEAVDTAVAEVKALADAAKASGGTFWAERRVHLDRLWTAGGQRAPLPLYGTNDFGAIIRPEGAGAGKPVLVVALDYKHGAGVPVEVRDNPQLLYYAVGVILAEGIDALMAQGVPVDVELVVVQPRAGHPEGPVRRVRLTGLDVMMWAHEVLMPAVAASLVPSAPLITGSHCRFCPALAVCPAQHKQAMDAVRAEFGPVPPEPAGLDGAVLADVLARADQMRAWLLAVEAEAERRVTQDAAAVPGWKLIHVTSGRTGWAASASDVVERLARVLRVPDATAEKLTGLASVMEIATPAQVRKRLKPEQWREVEAAGLLAVPSKTKPKLVPAFDPRPALLDAASEFAAAPALP